MDNLLKQLVNIGPIAVEKFANPTELRANLAKQLQGVWAGSEILTIFSCKQKPPLVVLRRDHLLALLELIRGGEGR